MNNINILIIDDEPQIRKLLQINLESNDYKVIQASTGKDGIALAANHRPDLILLDIGLPDISGHQVLNNLREWNNNPIIILSVQDNEADIIAALDNGATDYLTKPFRTGELLARIRAAIRKNQQVDNNSIITTGWLTIDLIARTVKINDSIIKLTSTEYSLLSILVKNEGKVLTHQYLLKEVWGENFQYETQYLRVFIGTLRKKIEKNPNNPSHIITESGIGYRFQ
ncbi:response regulator [Zunongwangia sp. HGR-M22]|uniref:response regulator n=1 Tax=Zunongwangia sp. HGR-M22 TaxID=3015168 RepID=UPI0022DE3E64|nr:response regulator transcription factor [Zunongwangia sp. HGR-M22]WBL24248.1 response regulator transcription factor [Zunongwangia sp. HGR-M22]